MAKKIETQETENSGFLACEEVLTLNEMYSTIMNLMGAKTSFQEKLDFTYQGADLQKEALIVKEAMKVQNDELNAIVKERKAFEEAVVNNLVEKGHNREDIRPQYVETIVSTCFEKESKYIELVQEWEKSRQNQLKTPSKFKVKHFVTEGFFEKADKVTLASVMPGVVLLMKKGE